MDSQLNDPSVNSEILVRSKGSSWEAPTILAFKSEAELQSLILHQPTLIPGIGMDAVVVEEMQSGAGPTDICIVSAQGDITIIECKLASNAEVRRKIVGQVLDYASQIWQMSFHEFDNRWKQRNQGVGIVEALGTNESALPATISKNLAEGRFDLILAVDRINADLRRIVEYLNHISRPETTITAFELRYAKHGDTEILVPAVYGAELAAAKTGSSGTATNHWEPSDVLDWLQTNESNSHAFVHELFEKSKAKGWAVVGTSAKSPSGLIKIELSAGPIWPFVIYTAKTGSVININFQWTRAASDDSRDSFLDFLANQYSAINAEQIREALFNKRPGFRVATLMSDLSASELVEAASLLVG